MILKSILLILVINTGIISKKHLQSNIKKARLLKKKIANTKLLLKKIQKKYQDPDKLNDILKFLNKNKERKLNPFSALGFGENGNSDHFHGNLASIGAAISIPLFNYVLKYIMNVNTAKKLKIENRERVLKLEKIKILNREDRDSLNDKVVKVKLNLEKLIDDLKLKIGNLGDAEDEENREELDEEERHERDLEFRKKLENEHSIEQSLEEDDIEVDHNEVDEEEDNPNPKNEVEDKKNVI